MPQILWDASGLIKRYIREDGSDSVKAILTSDPALPMTLTYQSYAETAAILRRNLNRGDIPFTDFQQARLLLETETLFSTHFGLLSVTDDDVLTGVGLTDLHNINSTDASILAAYLRYARSLPPDAPPCVLVAADRRLIRAAEAEGLRTLNPELVPAADIPTFLAGLRV